MASNDYEESKLSYISKKRKDSGYNPFSGEDDGESTRYATKGDSEANFDCCFISKSKPFSRKIKKRGKQRKEENLERKEHDKFSKDNIRRKIKPAFHSYVINTLNSVVQREYATPEPYKFRNLQGELNKDDSIRGNKRLLDKKVKEFINESEISRKYSSIPETKNKINFERLQRKKGIYNLDKFFNLTYREVFNEMFIKNNNILGPDFEFLFKGTQGFSKFIKCLRDSKKEPEAYIKQLTEVTNEYISYFDNGRLKKPRGSANLTEDFNINEGY